MTDIWAVFRIQNASGYVTHDLIAVFEKRDDAWTYAEKHSHTVRKIPLHATELVEK